LRRNTDARKRRKAGTESPLSLAIAGLLFGVGLRAGQAYALDGGDGRCRTIVYGEFVEARRVEGIGPMDPNPFWRPHAELEIDGPPDTIYYLAIFDDYAREGDTFSLSPVSAP